MVCRLCHWLRRVFKADWENFDRILGEKTDRWEESESNAFEFWENSAELIQNLNVSAFEFHESEPAEALRLYSEAAELKSAHAMQCVGWYYETGTVVDADFDKAEHFYRSAIVAGSWMATISYARLMFDHGKFESCEDVLDDGVQNDFTPAYFWMAWYRYKREPTSKTARRIRPLLEHAAEKGHPTAKMMLNSARATGQFGMFEIPKGLYAIWRGMPVLEQDPK